MLLGRLAGLAPMRFLLAAGGLLGLLAMVALVPHAAAAENVTVELRAIEMEDDCPRGMSPCWDKPVVLVPFDATVTLRLVGPTQMPHNVHVLEPVDDATRAAVLEEGGSQEVTFRVTGREPIEFVCDVHKVTMFGMLEPVHPRVAAGELVARAEFTIEGATVHADASASRDALGPVKVSWAWSDGATSEGTRVSHTFAAKEAKRTGVSLTVTAGDGASHSTFQRLRVSSPEAPTPLGVEASDHCDAGPGPCWEPATLVVFPGEHVLLRVGSDSRNEGPHRLRFVDPPGGAPPPVVEPGAAHVAAFLGRVTRDMPFYCEYHPNMTGRVVLGSSRAGPDGAPLPAPPGGATVVDGEDEGRLVALPPFWTGPALLAALARVLRRRHA